MPQKHVLDSDNLKIFETLPDPYLVLSPELYILTASDAYLDKTFRTREEIKDKHILALFPDTPSWQGLNSAGILLDSLNEAVLSKKTHQIPLLRYVLQPPAALGGGFEERYWKSANTAVFDEEGRLCYILHKISEVPEDSASRQLIKEFSAMEQKTEWNKFEAVFMQAPVAVGVFSGSEFRIELVNNLMCKVLNRPAETLQNQPLFMVMPEVKEQWLKEVVSRTYTTGIPYSAKEVQITFRRGKSWRTAYFDLNLLPVDNADSRINSIFMVLNDVSAKVEARQEVENRERQIRLVTDSLPVLIGYLDRQEKYRFTNKAYEDWFPFQAEELLGRTVRDVVGEKAYQTVEAYIKRALNGERIDFEATMPYREGFVKHIQTSYVPDIKNGQVQGFYTLVSDISKQVEVREKLEESKEKYSSLFEVMEQGFCIIELIFDSTNKAVDYRFLEVNPVFEKHTGLKEATGKTARELVPSLEAFWYELYGKVALSGETTRFIQGSEAMGRWFEVNAYRLGNSHSRKVALLFTDISERKKAELALKESEDRFRTIANAAPIALWMTDTQALINHVNQTWISWTGKPFDAHLGTGWLNSILAEDQDRVAGAFRHAFEQLCYFETDFRIRNAAGEMRWCLANGQPYYDTNGNFAGYAGSFIDNTDRKWTEEALKESENHFRSFANNIQNLAWMAQPDGWIYWYNQRWYDYTGTTFQDMQGWGWQKMHHPDHLEKVLDFLKDAWKKGETWELIFPLRSADGTYKWFLTRAFAVKDELGNIVRWIGTNTNIDEQKRAEASLAEKNRELLKINNDLDNFIYTASHDLKAPILNIEGLMNLVQHTLGESIKQNTKTQAVMDMIYKSINKFKETIKDLTEVAKVQSNSHDDLSQLSFSEMLQDVKMDIQSLIAESGARIEEDFSEVPLIYFSRKNLRSILYNLISNAIKYRSADNVPLVRISTARPDPEHILLLVSDNGLGMRQQDVHKVFKMFTRMHLHVEGTGIGMSIVKKIVDNNGGRIEIESEVNKGSSFLVYLKV